MAEIHDRWTHVQTLFESALDRPADERTAWLRAQCGDDPELYAEVASLLEGDAHRHTLLGGRAADLLAPGEMARALQPSRAGERVGPWRLAERIGAGGMGAVYRAERDAGGFAQTAALKLVKPGMDSEAVLARFRAERQILARLQHPGIARLLDGGLAADGRPYFAMELVGGEPITDYCDRRRLGVEARLGLFADVCEAVQYAHQALVVHRDLKPSNILVVGDADEPGEREEAPAARVKLLDFGIARLLGGDDGDEAAALTRTGQRVLTPSYAAPEQVRGEAPTTATDVYALGGLLYRLLSGARPVRTEGRTPAEVERAVLEETPPRLSAAVTAEAAAARGTTAEALARRLRGDLDVICAKALAKEPERRYGSAAELAADVGRHRAALPIAARPATRAYRVARFVRRHRAGVAGTAAAVVALAALTAVYTVRLAGERDRAEAEAQRSEQVVSFLRGLLLGADPYLNAGEELSATELLDRGAASVGDLGSEPETQAALQVLIGDIYLDMARPDDALPLYREALATYRARGPRVEAATTARRVGQAYRDADQPDEAGRSLRAALDELQALPDVDPVEIARAQRHLASHLRDGGDLDAAEALYREALATARRERGDDDELTKDIATSLVVALRALDRVPEAADLMETVVESDRRTLPDDDPGIAFSLAMYSTLLSKAGRGAEAIRVAREAERRFRAVHAADPDHPDIASASLGVAIALRADGQLAEADAAHAAAVEQLAASLGEADYRTISAVNGLARLKEERGQPDAAAGLFRRAIRAAADLPARQATMLSFLADNRARAGDWDASVAALRRSAGLLREQGDAESIASYVDDWAEAAGDGAPPELVARVRQELLADG